MDLAPKKPSLDSHAHEHASGMEAIHGDPADWSLADVFRLGASITWEHRGFFALLATGMLVWTVHPILALLLFPYTWALTIQATRQALDGERPGWRVRWGGVLVVLVPLSMLQGAMVAAWSHLSTAAGVAALGGAQVAYSLAGLTAGDVLAMASAWSLGPVARHLTPIGPDYLAGPSMVMAGLGRVEGSALALGAVLALQVVLVAATAFGAAHAVLEGESPGRGMRLAGCPARWMGLAACLLVLRFGSNQLAAVLRHAGCGLLHSSPLVGELVCYGNVWLWLGISNLFVVLWTLQYLRVRARH